MASQHSTIRAFFRYLIAALLLASFGFYTLAAVSPDALEQQLISRFGRARVVLLTNWLQTVRSAKNIGEEARLKRINDFINQNILFDSDSSIWRQSDYWATPLETIGQGSGDCEDFAIIKYVSLRMTGIPDSKLRLIYVKARLDSLNGPIQQAHMVLAYYASPNAEPQILDNLNTSIRPASKRKDLLPIFSFNSTAIYAGIAGKNKASSGGIARLSRWGDVWQRILAEGYE